MDTEDKLKELSKEQLINIINWTRRDLYNGAINRRLNPFVRGWGSMLKEAIEHQVTKAFNKLVKEEE